MVPADVAKELKPSTATRQKFLESAIARAERFLTNNDSTFGSWLSIDRLTNSCLAEKLAGVAWKDVVEFFTALEQFPTSLTEEVCQTV